MRKTYTLEPDGWPCTFAACPPGFFMIEGSLYLKSEYCTPVEGLNKPDAYCESGEYFAGGVKTEAERLALIVQPVRVAEGETEG